MKALPEIFAAASKIWPAFLQENGLEQDGKTGLYLFGIDTSNNSSLGKTFGLPEIGTKVAENMGFAVEKALRNLTQGGYTSFKTQDPPNQKFGGSVNVFSGILSAHGLTRELEHRFCLAALKASGNIGDIEVDFIQKEYEKYKDVGK